MKPQPCPAACFPLVLGWMALVLPAASANEEIGYIEEFALARDRAAALTKLIPGTEDYYYFHALHAQNSGDYDAVEALFEPWTKRYGETPRFHEIRHRQALLKYPDDPRASLAYLTRHLGLSFHHQQERIGQKPDFPESLDPQRVTWEAYRDEAFRSSNTLSQVADSGLDRILRSDLPLEEERLRDLLARVRYPDYPRLVGLVASDLRSNASRGFGEFEIHRRLLPEQLDELLRLRPTLQSDANFVQLRMKHLRPSPDVDWTRDAAEREAYLERLWDYAQDLDPAFNSLKAHALYQLLQHHHRAGRHPRELFLEYLRLPRPMPYVEPRYLNDLQRQRFRVDLNADFREVTACPPIHNDEALVRDFLLAHFVEDEDWQTYAPFIRDDYLKAAFAEAKLTHGIGDAERWYSLMSPSQVQALKDRIDIEFAAGNPEDFQPGDPVSLDVFVKNVEELMVKVYEINTLNFYLDEKRELNTDLDLDGLVANRETTHEFEETPIRRVRRTFTFESLADRRGAWVIEFIGNGRSSRALVRKGRLQYLSEVTPAGVAVTVLTQDNQLARSPSVWFGGREYRPRKEADSSVILLPFSNQPGDQPVVLTDGDFATFETISVPAESYSLAAGFHVDRENLLPGKLATLAVRPDFRVTGQPAPVSLLDSARLVLRATDLDGIESVTEIADFALFDDRESLHEFRVPERLAHLWVELHAEATQISQGNSEQSLVASERFDVNGIDGSQYIADLHLSKIDGEWILEALGKTGEPLPDRAVNIQTRHRDFQRPKNFTLKTNQQGRVALSTLLDHVSVSAWGDKFPRRSWNLADFEDSNRLPASIHARAGEALEIPIAVPGEDPLSPADFALLEKRAGGFVADVSDKAERKNGLLRVTGLEPGDYELHLRPSEQTISIRVTVPEAEQAGYALSKWRHLQIKNDEPLQIASLENAGGKLSVRLENGNPMARVHVVATRFVPEFSLASLGDPNWTEPISVKRGSAEALYISGRDIGDEYRYILERRAAKKFPGNLLDSPALLLNPWALRDTETAIDEAKEGADYEKKKEAAGSSRDAMGREADRSPMAAAVEESLAPSFDFLREQAPIFFNLVPDENGLVEIDLARLGDRQHVQVLAVDEENAAFRSISLAEGDGVALRDLRLTRNLDPEKHFSQRQKVTVLGNGDTLTLPDVRSSEFETYDTLASVWAAFSAIHEGSDSETLAKFGFLLEWPSFEEAKKRSLYSEHACHELNFFLSRRDPEFFAAVVRPYLENKRDKTFLDDYLIGADLASYHEPWAYGRLNVVEKILLARRIGGDEPAATSRYVSDLLALNPVSTEQFSYYFRSALRGRGISTGAAGARFGVEDVADRAMPSASAPNVALQSLERRAAGSLPRLHALDKNVEPVAASAPADVMVEEELLAQKPQAMGDELALGFADREDGIGNVQDLRRLREENRALFRKLEATKEWAENNYYHLPIARQIAELITANPFWRDFAAWDGEGGFSSREFPAASGNFAEMMFALSLLDVPFSAEEHDLTIEDGVLNLTAKSPVIVFHEEVEETPVAEDSSPILVSQNFFREDDRYLVGPDGQTSDKFVTEEFLTGVLYGSQVVVTNPTSSTRNLEVLLQIPRGALPAAGSNYTDTEHVQLAPFSTRKLETRFYFPGASGEETFPIYPVHVAQENEVLAWGDAFSFKVVDELSTIDKASWDYLSQYGSEAEVFAYLEANNVHRLDLGRIAWRCRESVDFFRKVTSLLEERHAWDATLWSYGLYHDATEVAREYLLHREDFLSQCGQWIDTELVSIDPVARHWYQHLEYRPLVNARAHRLGEDRKILNDRFRAQYQGYLKVLSYQPEFAATDELGVAYYLFLQDRVEEALERLGQVAPDGVESKLQLDYLNAYAALYQEVPEEAAAIAENYADYPVDRWRGRFSLVSSQVAELQGAVAAPDKAMASGDREHQQEALAAGEANLELKTEGGNVFVSYRNLDQVRVNYYEMDLEFLFSSNPFVSEDSDRFSVIRPNVTLLKELPENETEIEFEIPEQFASRNVLVEVVAGGVKRSAAIYSNSLAVQLVENFGRIDVRHASTGKPLPKTYVKVFARFNDGSVRFFKDGYTDLRGKFDYVSLNTNELDNVERLSLLVLSDEHGALVREVAPPQR